MNWDVFVSHASEDKEFAHALAEGLSKKGLHVWFDGFELQVGDSLLDSIDYGLSKSRFGAVVLSPSFFGKAWTKKELAGLTARETKGKKIILPIWHNISARDIRKRSPTLADRLGIDSVVGVEKTVERLFEVIKLEVSKTRRNQIHAHEQLEVELQKAKRILIVKETELKAVLAQADVIAHTDDLTYLPNRRQILGDLQREVIFADRYGTPLSISVLDIDRFEEINHKYGHITGDEILASFASILREPIRYPDTIGRYGGEEFLLVMPHSSLRQASEVVERLLEHLRSTAISHDEGVFHLTISAGIAQYETHNENWRGLLARADKALYRAKDRGRDQWATADS